MTAFVNRETKVQGMWKSSLLPLLYHGLDEQLADGEVSTDVTEMEQKAEKAVVRLTASHNTKGLVLAVP